MRNIISGVFLVVFLFTISPVAHALVPAVTTDTTSSGRTTATLYGSIGLLSSETVTTTGLHRGVIYY